MTACGTDYLSKDWLSRSYILVYAVFVYFTPLLLIIYSYFFIVQVIICFIVHLPTYILTYTVKSFVIYCSSIIITY